LIAPHCQTPAPLLGHYDPRAPGYIIKVKDYQEDFGTALERFQKKYAVKVKIQWASSNMLYVMPTESQVNQLRCDEAVESIEHDAIATTSNHRLERTRGSSSLNVGGNGQCG
jgi:hypothetical protein